MGNRPSATLLASKKSAEDGGASGLTKRRDPRKLQLSLRDRQPERLIGNSRRLVFVNFRSVLVGSGVLEDSDDVRPGLLVLESDLLVRGGRKSGGASDDVRELGVILGIEKVLGVAAPGIEGEADGAANTERRQG
jgi:hypothetical protein